MIARPNLLDGEDLPSEPKQKRSLENRARLKEAALYLFGEKGFERTSVDEIAQRANLAVGGFYLHYLSKRQLLLVLMDDLLEKLSHLSLATSLGSNLQETLHSLLSRAFSVDLQFLGACRAWEEAVLSDEELLATHREIRAWTTQRVVALFRIMEEQPGVRKGIDTPTLAKMIDDLFWSLLAQAVRMRRVEIERWLDSATHLVYHAFFEDQPESADEC